MTLDTFLSELKQYDLEDEHSVAITVSDYAEVMHYTGEYLEDAMNETNFAKRIYSLLLSPPFLDRDHEHVQELAESDAGCELEDDEYDDDAAVEEVLGEELLENWFEYNFVDWDLVQYDYKRGRVDLSYTRHVTYAFLKKHVNDITLSAAELSVMLPSGVFFDAELS
jgi:hypothetical protein